MLDAVELADMRTVQESGMPDTCILWRASTSQDDIGAVTSTWAAFGTTVCRVAPRQPGEINMLGGRERSQSYWVGTLPYGTDVEPGDEVRKGTSVFKVTGSFARESWATAVRVYLEQLQ